VLKAQKVEKVKKAEKAPRAVEPKSMEGVGALPTPS